MWWLWIVGYLFIGMVTGVVYARQSAKELIADPKEFRYLRETDEGYVYHRKTERTEAQRIKKCAESVFQESFWTGLLWPCVLVALVTWGGWELGTNLIVGKELKEARKKDEAKKAQKILDEWHRDEKIRFQKELE